MLNLPKTIKMVITDFDGIITDNCVYVDENGGMTRKLNFKDVMAFSLLKKNGYKIGIISGESNSAIELLSKKFGIEEVLKTWKGVLEGLDLARHRNSIYWKYLIYENIKRLGTTYIVYPDVDALAKTIEKTKAGVKLGIEKFNFYKHYEEFLKESALNRYFPDPKNRTGWVEFIGSSDPKKNEEIIKDVRALSVGTNWCTLSKLYSSISVEDERCGMYIFLDKGKTVYGVRTVNNLTQEIRDRHNLPTDLPEDALKSLQEKNPNIVIFKNSASMMD
jgi:hypothetical protein